MIVYSQLTAKANVASNNSIQVTQPGPLFTSDYVLLAVYVKNTTGITPVVSSIVDGSSSSWVNLSGFEEVSGPGGGKWYVGLWYGILTSSSTFDLITVTLSVSQDDIAVICGVFRNIVGNDVGCNVANSGNARQVTANVSVATINEAVIAAVIPLSNAGVPGQNWNLVNQFGTGVWNETSLLYILLGDTSGVQVATPMVKVGTAGWAVALGGFYPSSSVTPPAAPTNLLLSIFELNGGGSPIVLDVGATGSVTFTGGSDTTTPSFPATLANMFEMAISAIAANGSTVTIVAQPGYVPVLVPAIESGIFTLSAGSESGALTIEPATLSSSVDSEICVITFGANESLSEGLIISPVFPDTFSPRLAEDSYDSLSNDPTFTPNPYGPQPWTN